MTALPPLLALAQGRKVRPRRAPVYRPKEITLHMSVARLLREHARPEWMWFHSPNGEHRDVRVATKLKAMGVRKGIPDFVLVGPGGMPHFMEIKRAGSALGEEQSAFRAWGIKTGTPHCTVRSIDDVLAAFDAWGCLRIALPKSGAR
jgi:hypothetical protein